MISRDRFESCFNLLVRVEARLVYKAVQPLAAELSLDFREDRFYWLELRTVTDVPYRFHVQLWPPLFDARFLVDACIVHVQRDRPLSYFSAELLEVVAKVFSSARLFMNLDQSNSVFLGHGRNN